MKLNVPVAPVRTHEGAVAKRISPEAELRRSVMSCLLWEGEFYEDGETIADRICELIPNVNRNVVANLAIEARERMNLRHVPLMIAAEYAKDGFRDLCDQGRSHSPAELIARVIQRPDELAEFLAIYWRNGRCPLSAQVKKGLARAFRKFDRYQLAKYNRAGAIKLRDVMFLCHPKPVDDAQAQLWKELAEKTLEAPDTWEVALSGGADKKTTFERLLAEGRLGGLALLRNLRGMIEAGVSDDLLRLALVTMKTDRILPFRFIAAARHAPDLEPAIEGVMFRSLRGRSQLKGKTAIVVDVSPSMDDCVSSQSVISRMDAGCGVAMIARELCEECEIWSFSRHTVKVPPRRGFALRDAIVNSQEHNGTYLGAAVSKMNDVGQDRLIVITDEQSHDPVPDPVCENSYMINVASNHRGVGYGKWTHIDGWSEGVLDYIGEAEGVR